MSFSKFDKARPKICEKLERFSPKQICRDKFFKFDTMDRRNYSQYHSRRARRNAVTDLFQVTAFSKSLFCIQGAINTWTTFTHDGSVLFRNEMKPFYWLIF